MKLSYEKNFKSHRPDGRHTSTMAAHMEMLRKMKPLLELPEELTPEKFTEWKLAVKDKVRELMCMPEFTEQPEPVKLSEVKRDGYTVEKWEFYPDDYTVVPFLMLIPDGVSKENPAPGVMCLPGSTYSKEFFAGEPLLENPSCRFVEHADRNQMGLYIVKSGMVAFVFDNLETCEISAETDTVGAVRTHLCHGYAQSGLCYPGMAVFQKLCFMKFMKKLDFVDQEKLALCGHSLGTETALFLGVLCDEFKAVIYNEMMMSRRERYVAVTEVDGEMDQNIGNWHVVPGLYRWFDYPDLVAAFAPKYLALNEGGGEVYLEKVKKAYAVCGAEDRVQITQYPKYADPEKRIHHGPFPEYGISAKEWYEHNYCDPSDHSFRSEPSIKLLKKCFGME